MRYSLAALAQALPAELLGNDVQIDGPVVTDSREAKPGSLYVARPGEQADGHDYIPAAVKAGAVALVVEKPGPWPVPALLVEDSTKALAQIAGTYIDSLRSAPNSQLQVIGITGSAGKTTTKDLLAQILASQAPTVSNLRSFNNEVGMPLTALKAEPETRFLVLEMGADAPGNLKYLTSFIAPDAAVELLVGTAHLGGFGSREVLAQTKAELVAGLRPQGVKILNYDDLAVRQMAAAHEGPTWYFSAQGAAEATVRANGIELDEIGRPSFELCYEEQNARVQLSLVGEHHVANALAAATTALALAVPYEQVVAALGLSQAISPHRMHVFAAPLEKGQWTVIDDAYNANPDSMKAALTALAHLGQSQPEATRVAVLGQMLELGPQSAELHRQVGEQALAAQVHVIITVGPEAEPLHDVVKDKTQAWHCETPADARKLLDKYAPAGALILLKGSNGSRVYEIADELLQGVNEK
ncbi:hypothetical protein BSR29_03750 [Boudabousia liubingyangii]|uniref:UDP-N-acetylmuramoyl-tripeptide--D-alanyl-D-alanine ligase n=1 Tax=Boudabousia liubingyangii TaxID=1921764 RepID=A0A1Q5PN34_9ACTO|nr:UDP-N-acetylmuramoyl-tripeptide--D-alanyl-D-alanine ligase [Boudabousia liubingyangii]OKL48964.1 hypothetical protein BSR29_03750 [Boudabousia liubingyangii]